MIQDHLFESLLFQSEWYKTSCSSNIVSSMWPYRACSARYYSSTRNGTRPAVRVITLPIGMVQDQLFESFLFEYVAIQSLLYEVLWAQVPLWDPVAVLPSGSAVLHPPCESLLSGGAASCPALRVITLQQCRFLPGPVNHFSSSLEYPELALRDIPLRAWSIQSSPC